jgi:transketolase
MGLPTLYVWTHDSIGLGEDGPTHQPIEHLASLRAIPGLDVVRPGDANETAVALWKVLEPGARPTALSLSRQDLPVFPEASGGFGTTEGAVRGGYVRWQASDDRPDVILIATGSELQIAVEAAQTLAGEDIRARVVSMPCREWFADQDQAYRDHVIPPDVRARVSVEAGISQSWHDLVGLDGRSLSIEEFGASASAPELFEHFGLTPTALVAAARDVVARLG